MVKSRAPILATENLHKQFGGLVALSGVNLSVEEGQIKSVVGPNGAGKTTLFNIVTGFDRPSMGRVLSRDQDITDWSADRIVRSLHIARSFQITRMFGNLTVLENIMLGRHARSRGGVLASIIKMPWVLREEKHIRNCALELLDFVGLSPFRDTLSRNLPYGHLRMLEVARALASEPEVLLLDEPSAGLNKAETDVLIGMLLQLRDIGITILMIEHDMHLVMNISDAIHVLNVGLTLAEGTPREIQQNPKVVEAYLGKRESYVGG